MPIVTIPLTSFTGGEWSPRLHGRVDIAKYQNACEVLQNFVIYPHGGITRRMGMEYIEDAKTNNVRLIPFEYNREQAYVLEFGPGYIRFFRNGAQIVNATTGVPIEVATPYGATDLPDLAFTQSADVLYIVHEKHAPRTLSRTGIDTFTIATLPWTESTTASLKTGWTTNNYPRAVCFFQGRLVLGGAPLSPHTIWLSKVADFPNFTIPSTAYGSSDPIKLTLSSNQVNAIQWLVSGRQLLVGTTGGEWKVFGRSGVITPTDQNAERESNFGSKNSRVQLVGTEVIYSSRDGKKLRGLYYSFEADGYVSPELSILSEHLTRSGVKEFDFAQNPDGILWTVFNDGTFAGFTYLKSQEVQGWHRHTTDGQVISVCTIEGDSGSEVWFAVLRNGAVRIEKMKEPFEGLTSTDMGCTYLDSFLTYSGSPISTVSGLDHLKGKTVGVMADGQALTDKIVGTDGKITLEVPASKVIVGLKYTSKIIPLRPEGGSQFGFSQGKRKKVESLVVRLERSAGLSYGIPGKETSPVPAREFGQNFDSAIELFTGDIPLRLHNNWDRDGRFELSTDTPFPLTILMIAAKVMVNE